MWLTFGTTSDTTGARQVKNWAVNCASSGTAGPTAQLLVCETVSTWELRAGVSPVQLTSLICREWNRSVVQRAQWERDATRISRLDTVWD